MPEMPSELVSHAFKKGILFSVEEVSIADAEHPIPNARYYKMSARSGGQSATIASIAIPNDTGNQTFSIFFPDGTPPVRFNAAPEHPDEIVPNRQKLVSTRLKNSSDKSLTLQQAAACFAACAIEANNYFQGYSSDTAPALPSAYRKANDSFSSRLVRDPSTRFDEIGIYVNLATQCMEGIKPGNNDLWDLSRSVIDRSAVRQ